jgi:DNA polymerase-3 subunit delta
MAVSALQFPKSAADLPPFVVAFGTSRFLQQRVLATVRRRVLGEETDDGLGEVRLDGREAEWRTFRDEIDQIGMFGDHRLVVLDEADEFVTQHRAALETALQRLSHRTTVLFLVRTWPATTKLAKFAEKSGLAVDCKEPTGDVLARWLVDEARDAHGKKLDRDAAALLVELVGAEFGLAATELDKLVSYAGDRDRIGTEEVRLLVGGWKAETTFVMLSAVQAGRIGPALAELDKLLTANEAPQRILGGIEYVFRRLATATELSRQGTPLPDAAKQAGVHFREIDATTQYLRRLGRPRAERLLQRMVAADGDMKGGSGLPERIQLESLLVDLSPPGESSTGPARTTGPAPR